MSDFSKDVRNDIEMACAFLKQEKIIAYPTESVFGLGVLASSNLAISNLLKFKQRSVDKGFIVIASSFNQIEPWLQALSPQEQTLLLSLNHGYTYTWVIPTNDQCPSLLQGDFSSLAIRITQHPVAKAICDELDTPIVSSSANLSGQKPAKTYQEAYQCFGDSIFILNAPCGSLENPTKICNLKTGQILRA